MTWPGELAYLAASFTGKVTGLLNMDGIHDAIQILPSGSHSDPHPQRDRYVIPSQPLRSYLSRPNDSYQLVIVNTLIAIRHLTTPNIHTRACTAHLSAFS